MDEPTEVLFFPVPFWFFCSLRGFKYYLTMPTDTTPLPARWCLRNLRRLQHQRHWLHRQVGKKMPQKNKANCAGSFNIHGFMYDLYWIVLNCIHISFYLISIVVNSMDLLYVVYTWKWLNIQKTQRLWRDKSRPGVGCFLVVCLAKQTQVNRVCKCLQRKVGPCTPKDDSDITDSNFHG